MFAIRHYKEYFKCDFNPVKGKLLERVGRKTKDLSPIYKDMVAGLSGKNSSF